MKSRVYVGAGAAAFAIVLAVGSWPGQPGASAGKTPQSLEVHEWGTFTSMQGVDGHSLEGLHHEEEALPSFVHRVVETPVTESSNGKGGIFASRVSEKMETPVIYFYADKKMNVSVDVAYSSGIMSEWFPAARHDMSTSTLR